MKHATVQKILSLGTLGLAMTACIAPQNEQFFEPREFLAQSQICKENLGASACTLTPQVTTPGVVTILFTMSQIPQNSASLILVNAVKYASPLHNPKILFLKDTLTNGEDEGDSTYIRNKLLGDYDVEYAEIAAGGLTPAQVAGKDLIIVSNPGHPLSEATTLQTLTQFQGGVIFIGDDLAQGRGFSPESLNGLHFDHNGTALTCGGQTYRYDNLNGHSYQVSLNDEFLPGISDQYKDYQYGNDMDLTTANAGTQVLAWAAAATGTCNIGFVPSVVRRPKN